MRKSSQRSVLIRAFQKALEQADKATLSKVGEDLAVGSAYDDERDALLVVMSDNGLIAQTLRTEQLHATAERDARRAVHQKGVTTRNEIEAAVKLYDTASSADGVMANGVAAGDAGNGHAA